MLMVLLPTHRVKDEGTGLGFKPAEGICNDFFYKCFMDMLVITRLSGQ